MNRLDQLLQFRHEYPDDAFVLFSLGQEYGKLGDLEESKKCYLQLKEKDPDYFGLYYHLGKTEEKLGDMAAAIDTYKAGIEVCLRLGENHAKGELEGALALISDL